MASRKRMMWTSVAIVATLTIGVPSLSRAQARGAGPAGAGAQAPAQGGGGRGGGRGGAPPYTAAAGAKDLKAVLFNWAWYMGMLRSSEEYDVLMTLDYQGKGTMQVNGQPCNVTMYRSDISYRASGERTGSPALGPTARVVPRSKSSAARTPGTKTFRVPSSSQARAKPLRWRQPSKSG